MPSTPPKSQKSYSRKELAAEVLTLSGEVHDPAYLAEVVNGGRANKRLAKILARAVRNLESRSVQHGIQDKTLPQNVKG